MLPVEKGDHVFNGKGEQEWEIQGNTNVNFAIYGKSNERAMGSGKVILFRLQVKISMAQNYRSPHTIIHVNGNEKVRFIN